MYRYFKILADTRNKEGYHPEEAEMESHGHPIERLQLPVGDYCVATQRYEKMRTLRRHEDFVQHKFHGAPESKTFKMQPLDALGTYSVSVDVKQDCRELEKNLLVSMQGNRYRFERELQRAKNLGVKLYIVIADDAISCHEDMMKYESVNGDKECGIKMIEKIQELYQLYGTEFIFVHKSNLANKIVELLSQEKYLDEKEETFLKVG